jgi:hypothetical protein
VIVKRFNEKRCNYILGEDTDFAALLGRDCILIKNVKEKANVKRGRKSKKKSNTEIVLSDATSYDVQIAGSCNKKMNHIRTKLKERNVAGNDIIWDNALYPIF